MPGIVRPYRCFDTVWSQGRFAVNTDPIPRDDSTGAAPSPEQVQGTFVIKAGGDTRPVRVAVPRAASPFGATLPAMRSLVDASVELASHANARQGTPISCKPDCCACCYYAPMLSPAEARHIDALVRQLPEPRRSRIVARFEQALARLRDTGLLQRYERGYVRADGVARAGYPGWHDDYLSLGIACPFLDDKRCSIYAERPLACRNYVVISDPADCGRIGALRAPVSIRPNVARAAGILGQEPGATRSVMLVAALEWASARPAAAERMPGVQWLARLKAVLDAPEDTEPASGESTR